MIRILSFLFISVLIFSCSDTNKSYKVILPLDNGINKEKFSVDENDNRVLKVAISAMISPKETFNMYRELMNYISDKSGVKIEIVQRKTYKEVNDMLLNSKLDIAFICTGAFKEIKNKNVELLAVPVINGKPFYNAYIIVGSDSEINSVEELAGKSFAFTDPLSNSGHKFMLSYLKSIGYEPDTFFGKTIFTYAHDYSIQAVNRGIVDGATVDGLVYEYFAKNKKERVKNTRVIYKSKDYGIPPFVVNKTIDISIKNKIKNILLNLNKYPEGKKLLDHLMIDKFIEGDLRNY